MNRFAPQPGEAGGLQRPPIPESQLTRDDESSTNTYSPWHDDSTQMISGAPAKQAGAREEDPVRPIPKVDIREALFGRIVPWRSVALASAVVLAIGGVGGFIGGWAGKTTRASYEAVELRQVDGRAGGTDLTAIGEVAETIRPAVVSISVGAGEMSGVGSGVVIDGAGYILTNNHVVSIAADKTDAEIKVQFSEGGEARQVDATLVGRDTMTDLAVVKVENVTGLKVAQLADSDAVKVGDGVVAMGSPQGLQGTVTQGIVSALQRPVKLSGEGTDTDGVADAIQTDASINPGNSGGPLVDMRGAVIGINTVIFSVSGGSQGLGFAIPMNTAKSIAEQLIAGEQPHHPSIGVTTRTAINGTLAGAEIATVAAGGPAEQAGIMEGDVVTAVGDRAVESADELTVAIWSAALAKPGEALPVTVVREGQRVELTVTPS
ncbi:S1C family serine protease [Corynebacterium sp. H113]|uniref:S1C family serine protease n=1 Tax=Corynebacterium sp. H113 TaxID=3133419 RepID=UPI00309A8E8A